MWTYHETHSSTVVEPALPLEIWQEDNPQSQVLGNASAKSRWQTWVQQLDD